MKKILWNLFSILLVLAVFYFLGREFAKNWEHIRSVPLQFNLFFLGFASIIFVITFVILSVGWYLLLRYLHHPLLWTDVFLFFCMTQPAKYIPGKIWLPVARMKFCKGHGIPNSITLLSTGIEGVMEIFAGTYISLIALFQTELLRQFSIWGIVGISGLGLLILSPPVFYFFINLYLKIVKREPLTKNQRVSFVKLFLLQIIFTIGMFGFGVAQFLFLQSLAPVSLEHAAFLMGVGVFSYVASILAFFTPGGLGVREGIWYLALEKISGPAIGLVYAFVSRLWIVVMEALLAFITLPFFLLRQRRARQTNVLHRPL